MWSILVASLIPSASAADFDIVASRDRAAVAISSLSHSYSATPGASISDVPSWLDSLGSDGSWPDVDYTSGCDSPPGTFTAEAHLVRITGLGQAWSGLNPTANASYAQSSTVFEAATRALDWWIDHDYNKTACLQYGGTSSCPCGTPGLWNKNWWHQVIGIPTLASEACLMLYPGNLTDIQRSKCLEYGIRGSNFSTSQPSLGKYQTAANLVDIMQNVINAAVYSSNSSLLTAAYDTAATVFLYANATSADGIHPDGSFLQHSGQLYSGDYGVAFIDSFIALQTNAVGTQWQSSLEVQDAIATFIRGNDWQLFTNKDDGKLYWDLSSVGRFIAFPRSDHFATNGIGFNVSALHEIVSGWTGSSDVSAEMARELQNSDPTQLQGNKAYWASDYMVHRRSNFVLFNKMISTRTRNSEFTNGANPLGYHLNQGLLWSWVDGTEYQDIVGAWDWYLIPGSTVLYHYPTLDSSWIAVDGTKDFVGSVSDGSNGIAVMDYIDPHDGSISYRRAWFFMDDQVVNIIANATRLTTESTTPIVTVLDQRLASGGLSIDGSSSSGVAGQSATTVLYNTTGYYTFGSAFNLTASAEPKTGNWSAISTSTEGAVTQNIFTAYSSIVSGSTFAYGMLPVTDADTLAAIASSPTYNLINDTQILGIVGNGRIGITFWPDAANSATVSCPAFGVASSGEFTVTSSSPAVTLLQVSDSNLIVWASDPTQLLTSMTITLTSNCANVGCGNASACQTVQDGVSVDLTLPVGGLAGQTVHVSLSL